MASYPPPSENLPIFDALVFLQPLNATLTLAEADAKYLARQNIAVSIADTTSFSDNITVGSSLLDYTPAVGFQIRTTQNGETIIIRTLTDAGAVKTHVEYNRLHMVLQDEVRFRESATNNFSNAQQIGTLFEMINHTTDGITNFKTKLPSGVATSPFTLTSNTVTINPAQTTADLNGLVLNSAMFGRNDTGANTFNGTLAYTRYPIGWTINVSKQISTLVSGVTKNIITEAPATISFNGLSNGVWRICANINNSILQGTSTDIKLGYSNPTGATIINSDAASNLYHQYTGSFGDFGLSWPELIIRTTGNGTTAIVLNLTITYTVQPTVLIQIWATKVA